jgi:hypothetical protein
VPAKARTIAESATTSILLQQNVAQQQELMEKDRIIGELRCGLMISCNALKETNYMEAEVRQDSRHVVLIICKCTWRYSCAGSLMNSVICIGTSLVLVVDGAALEVVCCKHVCHKEVQHLLTGD